MKKTTIINSAILILSLFLIKPINGQETFEKNYHLNVPLFWWNAGGRQVEQASNGDYLILSRIEGIGWGNNPASYAFVKTDIYGDTLLTNYSTENRRLFDFCFTDDQSILAVGTADQGIIYPGTSILMKFNSDFEIIWTQTYGGAGIRSIIKSMDGQYVMAGGMSGYHMIKCNENGDSLWTKQYATQGDFFSKGVIECTDSSLILFGGNYDEYNSTIIKTDKNGDQIWNNTYLEININSICLANDGGFVAAGKIDYEFGVIKFDVNGDQVWSHTYNINVPANPPLSIYQGIDDEYLITTYPNYLIKINDDGSLIWLQNYGDYLFDVKLTSDNLLVATGSYHDSVNSTTTYLIKTDQDGLITFIPNSIVSKKQELQIYPNPSTGIININFEFDAEEKVSLLIQNINGQELENIPLGLVKTGNYNFDCSDFSPGIYFIKLQTDKGIITKKLIIE